MKPSFTIVGFGIAGANVCWELYRRNISFSIIDPGGQNASKVAAGMMNPIVFRRLTKSWMVDDLFPVAEKVYAEVQEKLGQELLIRKNIRRIFASVEEENNWSALQGDERFQPYMQSVDEIPKNVIAPHGTGIVKTIGHLKVKKFLELSRAYFKNAGVQIEERKFDYTELDPEQHYIFCEGYRIIENPFFNYLRIKPSHGDILIIQSEDLDDKEILNRKIWVQPLRNCCFKLGATYNWEKTSDEITESGKAELQENLEAITNCAYKVIDQQAGVRPTVPDRRPYLGTHPEKKNLHLFNGLGTKGVMLAPYFAKHLVDHLLDGKELMTEVDIRRRNKWYKS